MMTIKLQITSGRKSLGSVTLDEEQTKWVRVHSVAKECDLASIIRRAIHVAIGPDRSTTINHPF
jgi:hypothetical protein